ncbi:hypothetical protein MCP1_60010 [Candidatus Terasakiella magnetica]|nr:hypothetical protein MCP1_60010 [Candidatus Terasakiella magnetica]
MPAATAKAAAPAATVRMDIKQYPDHTGEPMSCPALLPLRYRAQLDLLRRSNIAKPPARCHGQRGHGGSALSA